MPVMDCSTVNSFIPDGVENNKEKTKDDYSGTMLQHTIAYMLYQQSITTDRAVLLAKLPLTSFQRRNE